MTKRTVGYRPAVSVPLESKLGFSHMSILGQTAERAARVAPNGVKKGTTFVLVFRCLNHTASPRKAFNGVQKARVHSKKHKPSKKIFCSRSTPGSPLAGLKFLQCTCTYMKYPVTGPSRIAVHGPIEVHSAIFSQLLGPLIYYTAVRYSDPRLYSGPRTFIGPCCDPEKKFMFEVFFL